ncbi:DUF262 domain-containing protein [Candidatus Avelusimicrobium alvi]|uniref:DUF262 domain-containing protein n=1 Tax=Candidatus Avelusimicrobium alvi TaxID=3416221 RepID=UPI003D13130C
MDAHKIWMLHDFIGARKVVFRIPVYQRNYDWSEENCNRLLDDIKTIIDTGEKHFLGTIVFMSPRDGGFALKEYTIIDGQQRLTTLMLLLKALADVSMDIDSSSSSAEEINESYLHNQHCEEKFKVKLKPISSDNEQFLLLLKNHVSELDQEGHIFKNYMLCKDRILRWHKSGINFSLMLEALTKLEIVEIVLIQGEDDPQIIFESINSTGLELSNADLIRNFLLMNVIDQEDLYENYWLPIERNLKHGTDYKNLNLFFTQYIIYKTRSTINSQTLYRTFVKFFKQNNYSHKTLLEELKRYSDIFKAFVYDVPSLPQGIRRALEKLRFLKQTTCYPFLLQVFDDYEHKIINEKELLKVLNFLVAYLLRRMVCGVPSNSLRGLFTYLYGRVFKVPANKHKYYEAINKFLFTVASKDAVPAESEFRRNLQTANIYTNPVLCKFLLMDIENGEGKEILSAENLTIEHVMPQTLTKKDWGHISADKHEEFLHTLGNLTITGYNSELSNKSFEDKKKIIQENSKAIILNSDILDKDKWNTSSIEARAQRLAQIVMEHYQIEPAQDDTIEFEYTDTLGVDDYKEVKGKKLVSFNFKGKVYRENTFIAMLSQMIYLLNRENPEKLQELADFKFNFRSMSSSARLRRQHISREPSELHTPLEIVPGIYIETCLSSRSIMHFLKSLLQQYNVNPEEFSIDVISDDDSDVEEQDNEE